MDLHRCRFVQFQPGAIHRMASHDLGPEKGPLVAVSRSDYRIELWQPIPSPSPCVAMASMNWVCVCVIPCTSAVESLCFAGPCIADRHDGGGGSDGDSSDDDCGSTGVTNGDSMARSKHRDHRSSPSVRLFAGGVDGSVIEFDLSSFRATGNLSDFSGGGAIWCMTVSPCQRYLAVGCEDGCVRLFDIDGPPGTLQYDRCFERQSGRIVSLLWLRSEDTGADWVVTGGSDGLLRKWAVSTGRSLQRMSVGSQQGGDGSEVIIWDLVHIRGNEIASADSLGCVKFWDVQTCTLLQSYRSHSSDILALAIDPVERNTLFAAGIDTKIAMFQKAPKQSVTADGCVFQAPEQWMLSRRRKFHTHDVRSLCWVRIGAQPAVKTNPARRKRSMNGVTLSAAGMPSTFQHDYLLSGGIDTFLTILKKPAESFAKSSHQPVRLSPFLPQNQVLINHLHRLVISHDLYEVKMYRYGRISTLSSMVKAGLIQSDGGAYLASLRVKGKAPIHQIRVTSNGSWLAVLDVQGRVHLYSLIPKRSGHVAESVTLANFSSFLGSVSSVNAIDFVGSGLIMTATGSQLSFYRLKAEQGKFPLACSIAIPHSYDDLFGQSRSFYPSPCGRWLCIRTGLNHLRLVNVKSPDTQYPSLPQIDQGQITHISFVRHWVVLYIAMSGPEKYTDIRAISLEIDGMDRFSRQWDRAMRQLESRKSDQWIHRRKEKICGDSFHDGILYFWSHRWMVRLDVSGVPDDRQNTTSDPSADQDTCVEPISVSVTQRFENILAFSIVPWGDTSLRDHLPEAVMVERPWDDILESMDAPAPIKTFGV